jgi:hypothetical protein
MRAFYSTTARVHEGQLEASIATAAAGKKVVGRHGGDVRLFVAVAAGEQAESTLFAVEYEDAEALGRAFDAMNTDPDLNVTRASGAGLSTVTSASIGYELPIAFTSNRGRGSVLEIHSFHVKPGRMEEFLATAAETCAFVEANGGLNALVLQLAYAGMATGLVSLVWQHENLAAHARMSAAWNSDAGIAISKQTGPLAADPPIVAAGSMLFSEVPL